MKVYNRRAIDVDEVVEELLAYADRLRPMVADTALLLERALDAGKTVLLEGGQATLLDVDHGTYPFVTSSNATVGGRLHRLRHPARPASTAWSAIAQGVHDARRRGPVPHRAATTHDGERLRKTGGEYGTTTGRPRRCGWYDAVDRPLRRPRQRRHRLRAHQARRAHRPGDRSRSASATTSTASGIDEMPMTQTDFHHARPDLRVPARLDGGHHGRAHVRGPAGERPGATCSPSRRCCTSRISLIGVGPDRDATVVRKALL